MYREVTMVEIAEVVRLWRDGVPKKRIAARLGLDPKTVRRYVNAAEASGVLPNGGAVTDVQIRDVLLALHPTGGRPRGDGWARCQEPARNDRAVAAARDSADEDSQVAGAPRRGDQLSDAAPLCRRRAQFRAHRDDGPGRRRRRGGGAAGRHRVGRLAHAAWSQTTLPRLDLYGRAIALSVRVSHLRGNDGAPSKPARRPWRSSAACSRCSFPITPPRSSRRRTVNAADYARLPRVRPGVWLSHRSGTRAAAARQRARRACRPHGTRRLFRRRGVPLGVERTTLAHPYSEPFPKQLVLTGKQSAGD